MINLFSFSPYYIVVNGVYLMEALNFPGKFWYWTGREQSLPLRLTTGKLLQLKLIQPGLSGVQDTVSFEDATRPGFYVWFSSIDSTVHLKSQAQVSQLQNFARDASFFIRTDMYHPQTLSFETSFTSGVWIHHNSFTIYGRTANDATSYNDTFRSDSSWILRKQG